MFKKNVISAVVLLACWAASCALSNADRETDALIESAKASGAEERAAALSSLLERRGRYAEGQIRTLLSSEDSAQMKLGLIELIGRKGDRRFNSELISALADQNEDVAAAAEDSLGGLLDSKLRNTLFKKASSSRVGPEARAHIVRLLSRDGAKREVELFIGLLNTDHPELKNALFEALQEVTHAGIGADEDSWRQWWRRNRKKSETQWAREILRRLEEENRKLRSEIERLNQRRREEVTALRAEAAEAIIAQLKKRGDRNDLAPLIEALDSKYQRVVIYSLKELAGIPPRSLPDDLSKKILAMLENAAPEIRARAGAVLASSADPGVVEPVRKLLGDGNPLVREKAAETLGKLGDKGSSPQLRALLKDASLDVRRAAIEAIAKLEAKEAAGDLITLLSDKDADIRWEAAKALGSIKAVGAVGRLIEILNDDKPRVRWYASDALGKIGDERAVEPLIKKLDDADPGVRENVLDSLMVLNDRRALDAVERKTADEEKRVSAKAWDVYVALASGKKETLKDSCEKYAAMKQYDRALELFDKYLAVYGKEGPADEIYARVNTAKIYVLQNRIKEASVAFRELISEYPDYVQPRREYFNALFEMKSFGEAAEHLPALVSNDSGRKEEYFRKSLVILENLFERKKFEELIDLVTKLEAADSTLGGERWKDRIAELKTRSEAALRSSQPEAPPEEAPHSEENKKETPSAEEK